jgi:hypothetical protein
MRNLTMRLNALDRKRPLIDLGNRPGQDPREDLIQVLTELLGQRLHRPATEKERSFLIQRFSETYFAEVDETDDMDMNAIVDQFESHFDRAFGELTSLHPSQEEPAEVTFPGP